MPQYKYKRVDGYQGVFADAKNNEDGTVEADHELNSVYLTPITEANNDTQTAQEGQPSQSQTPQPTPASTTAPTPEVSEKPNTEETK